MPSDEFDLLAQGASVADHGTQDSVLLFAVGAVTLLGVFGVSDWNTLLG